VKGKLPKGLKLYKGTGTVTISGIPTSTKKYAYPLTVKETFGKGKTKYIVTQSLTLMVS